MPRTIMLIPIGTSVGLTSVSLGVLRAMEQKGVRVSFFKPIAQPRRDDNQPDLTTSIIEANSDMKVALPLSMNKAESLIRTDQTDVLMEEIIARFKEATADADVALIEGLLPTRNHPFASQVNFEIAKTLDAEIVFVTTPGADNPAQLKERIEIAVSNFGGSKNSNIAGVIINKHNAPVDEDGRTRPDLGDMFDDAEKIKTQTLKSWRSLTPVRFVCSVACHGIFN